MAYLAGLRLSKELAMAIGLLVGVLGYQGWKYHQRSIGAAGQVAKQKKVDDAVSQKLSRAGSRSGNPAVRGLRDPNAAE